MKRLFLFLFLFSSAFAEIKAVIFECEGVVCTLNEEAVTRFIGNKLHLSHEKAHALLKGFREWKGSPIDYWANCPYPLPSNWHQQITHILYHSTSPLPNALPLINLLKEKGYHVGLITSQQRGYVAHTQPYLSLFHPLVLSNESGLENTFIQLLDTLALPPEEVLYIDHAWGNIEAARGLGIETLHYKQGAQLKRALTSLGLIDEERVELGTHSLWVESLGNPCDPPLLLIAGAGCHAHFWSDAFALDLAQNGYYVIRYDQRDVGLSSPYPESYSMEDLAKDVNGILDHFALDQAHLVGHSMGGYIAQLTAVAYPSRVHSLSVISSGPIAPTPETEQPLSEDEKATLSLTFDLFFANPTSENFIESLPAYVNVWSHTNGAYPLDIGMVSSYVYEIYTRTRNPLFFPFRHIEALELLIHTMPQREGFLEKLHAPTLIIHGGQDPLLLPHRGGIALFKALPHGELKLFPKMGHMLFNRELERSVAQTIKNFLHKLNS